MAVGMSRQPDVVAAGNENDSACERGAECEPQGPLLAATGIGSRAAVAAAGEQPASWQKQQQQQQSGQQHSRVRLVECSTLVGGQSSGSQGNAVPPRGRAEAQHLSWARTPTGQWMRVLSSTAISGCPNRERDKERVESTLGLPEFGDNSTEFYAVKCGLAPIAMGYDRVVYGDHGPYVELSPEHICWPTFQSFVQKPEISFYDEFWTCDGSTMLYAQKRPVLNKPNPPCGPYAVQNNRREGYANYLAGKYYLSADADTIAVRCVRLVKRGRRRRACRGGKAGAAGACGSEPTAGPAADESWSAALDDAESEGPYAAWGCGGAPGAAPGGPWGSGPWSLGADGGPGSDVWLQAGPATGLAGAAAAWQSEEAWGAAAADWQPAGAS